MLRVIDHRVEDLDRRTALAAPAGMFGFLDSKSFAAATIAAITAMLCYVSGFGGDVGLLVIPPLLALIYWLMFR
jgi:hypothetical protein